MNPWQRAVRSFLLHTRQHAPDRPTLIGFPAVKQANIMLEEAFEFAEACGLAVFAQLGLKDDRDPNGVQYRIRRVFTLPPHGWTIANINWAQALREAADHIIAGVGTFAAFGVDAHPFVDLNHAANMHKDPVKPGDAKAPKPPGWTPPDAGELLDRILKAYQIADDEPADASTALALKDRRWDWNKQSRALIAKGARSKGCVLEYVGGDISHQIESNGSATLEELGLENAPDGLSVWEGRYVGECEETTGFPAGSFRPVFAAEYTALRYRQQIWNPADWEIKERT